MRLKTSQLSLLLKRRGVTVATTADEVLIDWNLNDRIKINKIIEKGKNNLLRGNYNEAMENFKIATALIEKLDNFNDVLHYKSVILNYIGRVYLIQGNYDKSIETAEEMLKYMEQIGDLPGKAVVYNNI